MDATNSTIASNEQFISTLASLLEYARPGYASEDLQRILMAIFYGSNGSADMLELVDLLRSARSTHCNLEVVQSSMAEEAFGPY